MQKPGRRAERGDRLLERSKDCWAKMFCSSHSIEALQQKRPGVGRTEARQEEKEAGGQGVSVWGGCRGFLLGEHKCILSKSCSVKTEGKTGNYGWLTEMRKTEH